MSPPEPTLREMAMAAQRRAYAPYSDFCVGAAVEMEQGARFAGANVENAAFPQSICAERSAIVAAVSAGYRRLARLYIYTEAGAAPCGGCRSVMAEFGTAQTTVTLGNAAGDEVTLRLGDLIPHAFEMGAPVPFKD